MPQDSHNSNINNNEERLNIFSAIQPSGDLMLGNYFGSLKNWVKLQDKYNCYYSIANLHSITVSQNPRDLKQRTYEIAAWYVASGLDIEKSTIFIQSHVRAHAELTWLLSCTAYLGELSRMTQFKDKSTKISKDNLTNFNELNVNLGLFAYPVLMMADIVLYDADLVPVGEDQKQHLEFVRDVAKRVNNRFQKKLFKIPEPYISKKKQGARIMSLQEPEKKMSKSDSNTKNFIALDDPPNIIVKKIKAAITDTDTDIKYDVMNKPGISNLLTMYSIVSNKSVKELEAEYKGKMYGHLKTDLADAVVSYLEPLQAEFKRLILDVTYLQLILNKGRERAEVIANRKLSEVYNTFGIG